MGAEEYSERQFTHPEWAEAFYEAAKDQKQSGAEAIMYGVSRHPEILSTLFDRSIVPSLLLVGPDRGLTELPVVKKIMESRQGAPILVDAVDPNPSVGETLKQNLPELGDQSVAEFHFFDQTIEDYAGDNTRPYDLVIAAHSLQYVAFGQPSKVRGQQLGEVLRTLKDNAGLLAVVAQAQDLSDTVLGFRTSSWRTLAGDDPKRIEERHIEIESTVLMDILRGLEPSARLYDWVSHLGYSWFMDMSAFPGDMSTPEGQVLNEKAKGILSFLIRQDWDGVPEDHRTKILGRLEGMIEDGSQKPLSLYDYGSEERPPRYLRGVDYAIFTSKSPSPLRDANRMSALMLEAEFGKLF